VPAQPLVSVVIPTKDRNIEVRRAINSALRQTVREIEVIVVDDGSAEPARAVLSAGLTDSRLTYHRNESPTGPSAARNVGTALARGAFVAYLDSDDEWHPTKLEQQVESLSRHSRAGLSLCGFELRNGAQHKQRVPRGVRAGHAVELLDTRHEPTVTSCFVLPREIARTYLFDASLGAYEDLDLAARISVDHDIVTTRSILVRKHVSAERQFAGPRIIDARRTLLAKHALVLDRHPRVVARNELVLAAELARVGRNDDALALLGSIEGDYSSAWLRIGRRIQPKAPGRLSQVLDTIRRAEKLSVRGVAWRLRTSRLRWQN
jgi:glycosyltransferase involved in cell wall biosynthesis